LADAGLAALPSAWNTAVLDSFIAPPNLVFANRNLFFAQGGTGTDGRGHTNSNCLGKVGA
jgi:hypothetical protein